MEFPVPYCSFDTYTNGPFLHLLKEEEYGTWAVKASRLIDRLTNGRASRHKDALASELAYACGQIAEVLQSSQAGKIAAVKGVTAFSNDGYSESYASSRDFQEAINRTCYGILEEALGSDPYGLLYLGVI